MPDNERDRIIDQVAHVLIDVATTEDVTADAACDMARALDHEGLLRTSDDTDEEAKLRAERDHWEHHAWEAGEGFKRAIADAARAGARRRAMEAEVVKLRADVDHWQEVAELAEKDRRTYHRDADRAVAETAALRDAIRALADKVEHRMMATATPSEIRALDGGQS